MTVIVRFGPDDAARCRFAVSPLQETMSALQVLLRADRHAFYEPWLAGARAAVAPVELRLLLLAAYVDRWSPDFLWPSPTAPVASVDDELAAVTATAPDVVAAELAELARRAPRAVSAEVLGLVEGDPVVARDLLVAQQRRAWELLVEPLWERIRGLADADIGARSRRLAAAGLEGLLTDLHPRVVWRGDALHLTGFPRATHDLRGRGLILVPTAFGWPGLGLGSGAATTAAPALTYPMLGAARLWETVAQPPAVVRLLGGGRASVLAESVVPGTTTGLASRVALSPATVSEHLAVLRAAGLVRAERRGREVLYEQTPLGAALVNAASHTG